MHAIHFCHMSFDSSLSSNIGSFYKIDSVNTNLIFAFKYPWHSLVLYRSILLSITSCSDSVFCILAKIFIICQVSDKSLIDLIKRKCKLMQPYAGAFLRKDDK